MSNIGNKETMSKNLLYYQQLSGKSQKELADIVGVSPSTFNEWIKGKKYPRIDKIEILAKYFGILKSDLIEEKSNLLEESKSLGEKLNKGVQINVLGKVAAGIPIEAIENIVDTEEISEKLARTGEFFGLRIKGDSMQPTICNGDTVIVKRQDDANHGDIVIALVNGDNATCKRLVKYKDGISLISLNPSYEPMVFSKKEIQEKPVRIIGRVVENRRKF